ncbi:hypothetical protein RC74_21020 [Falsihalocynthiibacter arcticus]|uniref:Uncharacterized protein n=1 Tax=Falsihalocynthiibacter arcticus TaxID=1579316 RepID=A0A126V621_9RHOB|nr:hypothetical protein RC74_21020 [Falsihalocynthiibacter arcticus]
MGVLNLGEFPFKMEVHSSLCGVFPKRSLNMHEEYSERKAGAKTARLDSVVRAIITVAYQLLLMKKSKITIEL